MEDPKKSRRSFLFTAGSVAIACGSLDTLSLGADSNKDSSSSGASHSSAKHWSGEYWAKKGEVSLYLFRKRASAPTSSSKPLPVVLFAHGSSISGRSSFDLQVPGHGEYSMMDKFVEYGFDAWSIDFDGYGRSSRTRKNANIADGVEDLKIAAPMIAKETGQRSFHLYGESSGALRAGAFAMEQPEYVNRLILGAFTYTGKDSPTLIERAKSLEFFRTHDSRPRDREMIRSIFTRDKAGTANPAAAEALADVELKLGDSVPTGTYLDMTANLPLVDPTKLTRPVLLVRGEYDGIATELDLANFFIKLPNPDRQFAIVPGASHAVSLGNTRHLLWHVMRAFLEMPPTSSQTKSA